MSHRIEIFSAGCPLCIDTINMVKEAKCPSCTLTEYNIFTSEVEIKKYGIKAVPTIIIDDIIKIEGRPTFKLKCDEKTFEFLKKNYKM